MSKKPIRKLEDLQGMKILAQGFSPEAAKALTSRWSFSIQ
jgi:TRAP-type C4-dicarboxylate transport system substrate-binding protein